MPDPAHPPDLFLREVIQRAFADIPDEEADEFVSAGEFRSYPAGVVLCREGAIEDVFYIIVDGEVQVSKVINEDLDRLLNPLRKGDFFGEYALIHDAPRSASVTTTVPTTVLEINKDAFRRFLQDNASVALALVSEVSRRLQENNELSVEDLRMKVAELAAAYQQLAEMDAARREFLTAIAHELRTPLTAAKGFLQLAKMGISEGAVIRRTLGTVSQNLDRIVTLVNDILFLQELDLILLESETVEPARVVKEAVESQREYAGRAGVWLHFEAAPGLPAIQGDPKSLERVFAAMIENAVKFSPDGGEVRIAVSVAGDAVRVRIADQGVGIPEEAQAKIFDRFFHIESTGDHLFDGLGLGLSIAKQVIDQHGGTIEVESAVGEGSTFTVGLPVGKAP